MDKDVFFEQMIEYRDLFEEKLTKSPEEAEDFLWRVEYDLKTYKHPDPYKNQFSESGTTYQRNTPLPDWVCDEETGMIKGHSGATAMLVYFFLFFVVSFGEDEFGCPMGPNTVPYPFPQSQMDQITQATKNIEIEVERTRGNVPSISLGIVIDQTLAYHHGFGLVNGVAPTPDIAYRIGSISKVFTSAAAFVARDRGFLDLDAEVELLKDMPTYYKTQRRITFSDLLSHRAGIARSTPCQSLWGECNVTLEEVIQIIETFPPIEPMDSRPSYSNLGFALAGHIVANLTNTKYEEFVQTNIFDPLKMTHAGFLKNGQNVSFLAPGYEGGGTLEIPSLDFGFENPAGGIYASVNDLASLLTLLSRDNVEIASTPNQIFDGATIREWLDPVWVGAGGSNRLLNAFGRPWEMTWLNVSGINSNWVKGKDGAVLGYTSQILFVPELKLGVIALLNGGLGGDATKVAYTALNMISPVLSKVYTELASKPPLPPTFDIIGNYEGADYFGYTLPSQLSNVSASVTKQVDSNGNTRLYVNVKALIARSITTTAVSGFINFSDTFSNNTTHYFILSGSEDESCPSDTGGGFQYVKYETSTRTLSVDGLFYGILFKQK